MEPGSAVATNVNVERDELRELRCESAEHVRKANVVVARQRQPRQSTSPH